MLGMWDVYTGHGAPHGESQGTVSLSTDLGGCLMEEQLNERPDYSGWSFNSSSPVTGQWHRKHVDKAGRRIALSGRLVGDAMVMSGAVASPSGQVLVRVTWDPRSSTEVRQTWEFSRDGGGRGRSSASSRTSNNDERIRPPRNATSTFPRRSLDPRPYWCCIVVTLPGLLLYLSNQLRRYSCVRR